VEVDRVNYFVAASALKVASANAWTRSAYRAATMLKTSPRKAAVQEALWCLEGLPDEWQCLLDLGTGWAHVLCIFCALLRQDELHAFDTEDMRNWRSFQATVPLIRDQVLSLPLDSAARDRAQRRAEQLLKAADFDAAYQIMGLRYHCSASGCPDFPEGTFDRIMSIDVLEHVDADKFLLAAQTWHRILKPGRQFVAQVGLDDHLAFHQGRFGSKRYMRYSERAWRMLIGNSVQYINRLTASEIIGLLTDVGFSIESIETDSSGDTAPDAVHPDYRHQSEADIRAVRLMVRARKP
jgi:SAM-dependent methyltransferase